MSPAADQAPSYYLCSATLALASQDVERIFICDALSFRLGVYFTTRAADETCSQDVQSAFTKFAVRAPDQLLVNTEATHRFGPLHLLNSCYKSSSSMD